jgi:hypothetical protein
MIRTVLCAMLLCLSVFQGYSQVNYIDYHKKIIGAEELFLQGKVDSSLMCYRKIFTGYDKCFAKDCFNALQLACMTYDTMDANYFFKKCFENGVSWTAINYAGQINRTFNRFQGYKERTKELYDVCRATYYKTVDIKARSEVMAMRYKDGIVKSSIPFGVQTRDEWAALYSGVLDANIQELVRISQMSGLPGEHRVGFSDHDLDFDCEQSDVELIPIASLLFFHHGCGYWLLKKELMDAVIKGELHPREYALIYEWSFEDLTLHPSEPGKNDVCRFYKVKCNTEKQDRHYNLYLNHNKDWSDIVFVNKCRADLGISTVAHDELKKQYAKKYGLRLFYGLFEEI